MSEITLLATGDSLITRSMTRHPDIQKLSRLTRSFDVVFSNLEISLKTQPVQGIPAAQSGGFWSQASSEVLETLHFLGINLVSLANNHIMDYSAEGLSVTRACLRDEKIACSGAGASLGVASSPCYVQAGPRRIALISLTSTFHEASRAGEQTALHPGRPGVNPLRVRKVHQVTRDQMTVLQAVASGTDINALLEYSQQKGNLIEDEPGALFYFGDYDFELSKSPGTSYQLNESDVSRTLCSIEDAACQSDLVLVSVHCHDMVREGPETVPEFLQDFARKCIVAGAHAFLGHGPHFMRGIELFENRPVFYGLGNFIFQNFTVDSQPQEMFDLLGLNASAGVSGIVKQLTAGGRSGLSGNPEYSESVLPACTFSEGRLREITLHPVELSHTGPVSHLGVPKLSRRMDILERLRDLSKPFGTKIDTDRKKVVTGS